MIPGKLRTGISRLETPGILPHLPGSPQKLVILTGMEILEICKNSGKMTIPHRSVKFIKFIFSFLSFILFSPTASQFAYFV